MLGYPIGEDDVSYAGCLVCFWKQVWRATTSSKRSYSSFAHSRKNLGVIGDGMAASVDFTEVRL